MEPNATILLERSPPVGRFSVEFELTNHVDVIRAQNGDLPADQIRRTRLSGLVDTGSTRLVLPTAVVTVLGLPDQGEITVRFADGRRDAKRMVGEAQLELLGRSGVFSAVVEPGRSDALIGAIVLEELDLIPDCTRQQLVPRDPGGLFAELD